MKFPAIGVHEISYWQLFEGRRPSSKKMEETGGSSLISIRRVLK
jgi:hypothetical protein